MSRFCWDRDDADRDLTSSHDLGEFVDMTNPHPTDHAADFGWIDINDTGNGESLLTKSAITRQCLAQIAGTDNNDRPFMIQAEFAFNLENQIAHFVPNATSSVTAEIAQIFTNFGGIDCG